MRSYAYIRELNPTPTQIQVFRQHVGSVRFAQNWSLNFVKEKLESNEKQSWSSISLHTAWRQYREEVAPWFREISKEAFQYGCERTANALKNFSKNREHFKFPKYRKRGQNDSICYTSFNLKSSTVVRLPRNGDVELKESLQLIEGVQRITAVFVREKAGRWFITFRIREDKWTEPEKKEIKSAVGVDAGVGNTFAAFSTGVKIENPRYLRNAERQLKYRQRALSRKKKGSRRREIAKKHVQRLHFEVSNKRKDFTHKFTTNLVKSHDEIVIEDLNLHGMKSGLKLGKSVSDVAWGEVRRQLEYKCSWYGTTLTVVDRFFASSKLCSHCGFKNQDLKLSDRSWTCPECNANLDRDLNAALNLVTQSSLSGSSPESAHGDNVRQELALAVFDEVRSSESFDIRI